MTVADAMRAEGFVLEQTGGNCTAWVRRYDDGTAHYITLASDPLAPESWGERCVFALLDADRQPLENSVEWDGPKGSPFRNLFPLFRTPR